jgi:amino acid adenylation domain-containing protein/non-ribosomal peptide synthase protein (TIGR01720 family)
VANRLQSELEPLIGFFVNTLVLRVDTSHECLSDYLQHVRQINLDAQSHQDIPFEQLVEHCQVVRSTRHSPLFQIALTMDMPNAAQLSIAGLEFSAFSGLQMPAKFDLEINAQVNAQGIEMSWLYDKALFNQAHIEQLSEHFSRLLGGLVADNVSHINQLPLLSDDEMHYQLQQLNNTSASLGQEQLLHQLFERQVVALPNAPAVVYQTQSLSYSGLNCAANRLAHYLRAQGVGLATLVGIYLERSVDTVVAILAVLKAGGAYVPLDLTHPAERLSFMLSDAKLNHVLTQMSAVDGLNSQQGVQITVLDAPPTATALAGYSIENPAHLTTPLPSTPAYVIYTSGSTGQPKGVVCLHKSVINLLADFQRRQPLNAGDQASLWTNTSFDVSVYEMFSALCFGATLHVIPESVRTEPTAVFELLLKKQIHSGFLPAFYLAEFNQWLQASGSQCRLKRLLVGVESINHQLLIDIQSALPDLQIINGYGPSETTICSVLYNVDTGHIDSRHSVMAQDMAPIGQGAANTCLLVLDEQRRLLPKGVVGELYIGGLGVGGSYLNQPELTAQRFIENPFNLPHPVLYKTGDLVRWSNNEQLVFVGRVDEQVKLRGYRIELGEIESQLSALDPVDSCVVVVREDDAGQKRLVAYVVPTDTPATAEDKAQQASGWKSRLQSVLPGYMVPSAFVVLLALPLTANGKVDKKALPAPDGSDVGGEYVAPTDEIEPVLAQIWAGLLSLEVSTISTTADFFELGGDSILSIQVVSQAARSGLHFSIRDLFNAPTIQSLALVCQQGGQSRAPQQAVTGALALLPIQQLFFTDEVDIHHFNQSVMLKVPSALSKEALRAIVTMLVGHHDALRLKFFKHSDGHYNGHRGGNWGAEHQSINDIQIDSQVLTKSWPGANWQGFAAYATSIQQSLDPESGILFKAVLIEAPDNQVNGQSDGANTAPDKRLLLVIHHLVVDGMSWRILLADLETLYSQYLTGKTLTLPPKTSSYQQWGEYLRQYSQAEQLQQEAGYWFDSLKPDDSLGLDTTLYQFAPHQFEKSTVKLSAEALASPDTANFSLSKIQTQQLLSECGQAYRTKINELLLAGLLLGVSRCSNEQARIIRIDLEGHGREPLTEQLDTSRTVGWFTCVYPLTLSLPQRHEVGDVICAVKDQYRAIPNNGIGFGILKRLSGIEGAADLPESALVFNYLGQFDQVVNEDTHLSFADETTGEEKSHHRQDMVPLSLTGVVSKGCLQFTLSFDANRYDGAKLQEFMNNYAEGLGDVITHCLDTESGRYTVSDFPLADVTAEELAQWGVLNDE